MAEKHVSYNVGNSQEVMQALYDFIKSSGQDAVRIVSDEGVDAVYNGSDFGTPTGSSWWGVGSYLVVEPVAEYQSGGRWQCVVLRSSTSVIQYEMAPDGDWTNAVGFTTSVTTGLLTALSQSPMSAGDSLKISASDIETYSLGGISYGYTYLMCHYYDSSSVAYKSSFYVGGYIPFDEADTKPVVVAAGAPIFLFSTAEGWGYQTGNSTNYNRAQVEYPPRANSLASAYACLVSLNSPGYTARFTSSQSVTFNGAWPMLDVYVASLSPGGMLGKFGNQTMGAVDSAKPSGDTDVDNEWLVLGNGVCVRWKPSA